MAQGENAKPFEVILTPTAEVTNSVRLWDHRYKVRDRLIVPAY